jgi:hypothetical protein
MPTVYESSLKAVADREHSLVYQFQFKKLERANSMQWWNVRDLKTGKDIKIHDSGRTYADLRDPTKNKLIWADTLLEQTEAELFGDAPAPAPAFAPAPIVRAKRINREFNLSQQQAILTEVVFGSHKNPKTSATISPFHRNDHGNNGHFFASVVTHLNSHEDGPFVTARAVQETVKTFVESAVEARRIQLESKYGSNYMQRVGWDVYSEDDDEDGSTVEDAMNTKTKCQIAEMLDALIYRQFDSSEGSFKADSKPAYTESDDVALSNEANGENKKRARTFPEKVRPKSTSAVAQIESNRDELSGFLATIKDILSVPAAAALNMSPATQAPDPFDAELLPLLNALKSLNDPPGTTAVCKNLVSSLGNYGITTLEELRAMEESEACTILKELKWTTLQIKKVLHPK